MVGANFGSQSASFVITMTDASGNNYLLGPQFWNATHLIANSSQVIIINIYTIHFLCAILIK